MVLKMMWAAQDQGGDADVDPADERAGLSVVCPHGCIGCRMVLKWYGLRTPRAETQMTVWMLPTSALAALTALYPVLRMALVAEFKMHLEFSLANRVPLLHAGSRDMCALSSATPDTLCSRCPALRSNHAERRRLSFQEGPV